VKIIGAIYAEFLGFEANTYFSGITHDQNQISAFVSWVNITGILFTFGLGFGNVVRANVSNYIGEGKYTQAKNACLFYTVLSGIVGFIFMILILALPNSIASIYTPLESVQSWIVPILYVYSIGAFLEMVSGIQNTIMRVTNRTGQVIIIVASTFLLQLCFCSWLFGFELGWGVIGFTLSFVLASLVSNIVFAIIIHKKINWNLVKIIVE